MTTADGRPPGDGRHARPEDPDQAAQTAPAAEPAAEPGEAGPSAPAGNAALAHDTTRAVMAAVTPGLVFRWAVAATVGVFVVGLVFSGLYAVRNILLLIVVTAFFVSVVPPLAGQASRLTKDLPRFIEQLPERFRTYRELSDRFNLTDRLSALAASIPSRVGANALGFVQRFLGALLSTLTVLVLTIYFMADLPRLRRGFVRLFPRQHRPRAAEIVNVVVDKVGGYMIGNIIISVFAGVSTFIVLVLLKVPYALPLAVAVAITDLIPFVGATLGAAICVLVALVTKDLFAAD